MSKKYAPPVSQPPYWWISGPSFAALKGQFLRASELARLEVRVDGQNKMTFIVVDPASTPTRADGVAVGNVTINDTLHCPPFCAP